MKNKAILGLFVALFAIVVALNVVSAALSEEDFISDLEVEINDQLLGLNDLTPHLDVSDTVPVEVYFVAAKDASDVKVRVTLEGLGLDNEPTEVTSKFHIEEGGFYRKVLILELPSAVDLDDLSEDANLVVKISANNEDSLHCTYDLQIQRLQDSLAVLTVDAPSATNAGSVVAVDVVVENDGYERLENVYVKASIPELGVQKRVFLGDLSPQDDVEVEDSDDEDETDTLYKTLYLTLPRNVVPGTYDLKVEAYNVDASTIKTMPIAVDAVDTKVLSSDATKTVAPGEEAVFNFEIVNPSTGIAIYDIVPENTQGLIVEVVPSATAVSGEESKTIVVKVRATESAEEGTHVVTLNVNSESGLVEQKNFTVNVEKDTVAKGDAVFILTVVLVIVFVVLLIILTVLLTKRPAEAEEFGETSYY